jgi:hypothetical protein
MYLCLVSVNCDWERLTTLFVHEYEEVALRCCMQMEVTFCDSHFITVHTFLTEVWSLLVV